jgi:hypothetical protein
MTEQTKMPNLESLIGRYIVIERIDGECPAENKVQYSLASGSDPIKITGYYWNNSVDFIRNRNTELKLTEVIDTINTITYNDVSMLDNSKSHIYKIIGLEHVLFYNYTPDVPTLDQYNTQIWKYPENKDLMTPDSMLYMIGVNVA